MSGFDHGEFDKALDDLEEYLGYLKGNELAAKTFYEFGLSTIDLQPAITEFDYTTPCPNGRFAVKYDRYPSIDVGLPADDWGIEQAQAKAKELKEAMDVSYQFGLNWASGIAAQARSICDQFTEPYVPTLTAAMDLMQAKVVNPLQVSANDNWANLGGQASLWGGDFADEFHNFYDNYDNVMSRFSVFCGWINLGFGLGTKIIAGTQLGAGKFVTSLKKNIESQLDHWVDSGGDTPSDPSEWPAWVGNVASLVDSTLSLASDIPIVGEAADLVELTKKLGAVAQDIDGLLGGNLLPEKETYSAVMTAEAANDLMMRTLYDDHYQAFTNGMDRLDVGGEGSNSEERGISGTRLLNMMKDVKFRRDWGLDTVPPTSLA